MDAETRQVVLQELSRLEDDLSEVIVSGQDAESVVAGLNQLRSAVRYLTQTVTTLVDALPSSTGDTLLL